MKVYDCFGFNDENHLLEIRLNEMDKFVDYFIIIEFGETHQGKPKTKNINTKILNKFSNKVRYYFVEKFDNINKPHGRDQYQRNSIIKGLFDAQGDDVVIISDIDEIPDLRNIDLKNIKNKIIAFSQLHTMYKLNLTLREKWIGTKLCKYKNLKSPQWLRSLRIKKKYNIFRIDKLLSPRYTRNFELIENGGWHFGWLRDTESIISKIQSYAHSEHNTEYYKNKKFIEKCINEKRNFFNTNEILQLLDSSLLPIYIQKNFNKYSNLLS
tara:strand:+ start:1573 stop:2376 length:804 start_codon:yes stop_codon:yes gene_type:complete